MKIRFTLIATLLFALSGCDEAPKESVTPFRVERVMPAGECQYSAVSLINGERWNSGDVRTCDVQVGDTVFLTVPDEMYRAPYVTTRVVTKTRTVTPVWYIAMCIILTPALGVAAYKGFALARFNAETAREVKLAEQKRLDKYAKDSGITT